MSLLSPHASSLLFPDSFLLPDETYLAIPLAIKFLRLGQIRLSLLLIATILFSDDREVGQRVWCKEVLEKGESDDGCDGWQHKWE